MRYHHVAIPTMRNRNPLSACSLEDFFGLIEEIQYWPWWPQGGPLADRFLTVVALCLSYVWLGNARERPESVRRWPWLLCENSWTVWRSGQDAKSIRSKFRCVVLILWNILTNASPPQEVVYLSDPLALHHVIMKDQHLFEEPDVFIMLVLYYSFTTAYIDFAL
jgi:hypothetical protein